MYAMFHSDKRTTRTSRTPGPASLLAVTSRLVREEHSVRGDTESASCRAFLERLSVWSAGRQRSPSVVSIQFWLRSSCEVYGANEGKCRRWGMLWAKRRRREKDDAGAPAWGARVA